MGHTWKTAIAPNAIYVFIDASNVWNAVKSVKKFIEYKILKDYFKKNFNADKTGGNGYFDIKDINEFWGKDLKHREK